MRIRGKLSPPRIVRRHYGGTGGCLLYAIVGIGLVAISVMISV